MFALWNNPKIDGFQDTNMAATLKSVVPAGVAKTSTVASAASTQDPTELTVLKWLWQRRGGGSTCSTICSWGSVALAPCEKALAALERRRLVRKEAQSERHLWYATEAGGEYLKRVGAIADAESKKKSSDSDAAQSSKNRSSRPRSSEDKRAQRKRWALENQRRVNAVYKFVKDHPRHMLAEIMHGLKPNLSLSFRVAREILDSLVYQGQLVATAQRPPSWYAKEHSQPDLKPPAEQQSESAQDEEDCDDQQENEQDEEEELEDELEQEEDATKPEHKAVSRGA